MTTPDGPAVPLSLTVPVEDAPPAKNFGENVMLLTQYQDWDRAFSSMD